ncbi:MAG: hypothetical protein JKX71_04365 [Amylibacter sp.]|nr:hypothetical protein [Amylibacter sp.]
MHSGILRIKPAQNKFIDWPVELQLSQDIKLFNEVLAALDAKPVLPD